MFFLFFVSKGVGRKGEGGNEKKQDRKIAPLIFSLLYQYHVWKSRRARPLPPAADAHACILFNWHSRDLFNCDWEIISFQTKICSWSRWNIRYTTCKISIIHVEIYRLPI